MEDLPLLIVSTVYLLCCPYNKVEESFNTQATHDVLIYGPLGNLSSYDHLEFPGVVPRTFIGPLALAAAAWPGHWALTQAGAPKLWSQVLVRFMLGLYVWIAFRVFRRAAARKFGRDAAVWLCVVSCCQFHVPFYMTRTLPNVFALGLVLLAYAALLAGQYRRAVCHLAIATAWFRCDIIVLAAPLLLSLLLRRNLGIKELVITGVMAGLGSIAVSVLVDSYFWRRSLWPEGVVLFFNTIKGGSAAYGISAWHWYFTHALPKALLATGLLIPVGVMSVAGERASMRELQFDREVMALLVPVLAYVGLYSFLGHKELRFIFPAIPALNLVSAVGLAKLARRRDKGPWSRLWFMTGLGLLLATAATIPIYLAASMHNYPGGQALWRLHEYVRDHDSVRPLSVHIGVYPAETGVSRFGELDASIHYSKAENLTLHDLAAFDYLLADMDVAQRVIGRNLRASFNGRSVVKVHQTLGACEVIELVHGYGGLALRDLGRNWRLVVESGPLGALVRTQPKVVILRNRRRRGRDAGR